MATVKTIALVSNTSWYLYNLRLGVIKALQAAGYHVVTIAPHDAYSDRLTAEGCEFIEVAMENKGTNPVADVKLLRALYVLYRRVRPAFIFHYTVKPNIYGSLAARWAGVPSIAVVSGAGYAFLRRDWLNRVVKSLYRTALAGVRQVWFVNQDDKALFLSEQLVSADKVEVLPGEGINTEHFNPARVNAAEQDKPFVFLLSARMLWDKGVGEFVEAARLVKATHPDTDFQLLGFLDAENPSAISHAQMESWTAAGVVRYRGVTDHVIAYLAQADCVVLPSAYREGVPRALLEAASLAKPIITTDNVGCRDVVEDGRTGYLCRMKDAADLAVKMRQMLALTPEARQQMGLRGREKVIREFEESLVIRRYLDALHTFLE